METILETIVRETREAEGENIGSFDPAAYPLEKRAGPVAWKSLAASGFFLIAEVKKGSPSRGLLRPGLDPVSLAVEYEEAGASAVSVVTESRRFFGRKDFLSRVKERVRIPVLRKDFLIHPCQVYESYILGADLVLLIAACLPGNSLAEMREAAGRLGLGVLLEIHGRDEMDRALAVRPDFLGLNNRDLNDFSVDWRRGLDLRPDVPPGIPVIAESGISDAGQVRVLKEAGFAGILVGERLVCAQNPGRVVRELLHD